MNKILSLVFTASILLSACGADETPSATMAAPPAQNDGTLPTEPPAVETATRLEVDGEALNGLEVSVCPNTRKDGMPTAWWLI